MEKLNRLEKEHELLLEQIEELKAEVDDINEELNETYEIIKRLEDSIDELTQGDD